MTNNGTVNVGQNVELEVEGDTLIIRIDLTKRLGLSGSKKSVRIASTLGSVKLPWDETVKLGVNVFTKENGEAE